MVLVSSLRRKAIEDHNTARRMSSETDDLIWEFARKASEDLVNWRMPEECAIAALIAPLMHHKIINRDQLADRYGQESVELAQCILNWHSLINALPNEDNGKSSSKSYSIALRQIFQQTYLDLPDLKCTMLLIAEHNARLNLARTKTIAKLSQSIFIPLVEMLGIWRLRRSWLEMSTSILKEDEYEKLLSITGEADWYTSKGMKRLVEQSQSLKKIPKLIDKAQTYESFKRELSTAFENEGIIPKPRFEPREVQPGGIIRRSQDGESIEELSDRLAIRIFCYSKSDCYRVLGIVHGLGKPVAPKYSERFDDYIAAPQSNGYRALHTALVYRGIGGDKLVEVRILTPKMHRLNECGAIAAFFTHKYRYTRAHAWWNDIDNQIKALNKRFKIDPPITLFDLLEKFDLASSSNPVYVFTPRGEIVFLGEGNTTLDFAYHIHSELGRHAGLISVNGQVAPYNYPLRNGDLVNVEYLANSLGPDISWLGFVKSSRSKSKIQRQLRNQAQIFHPGRTALQEALLRLTKQYRDQLGYDPLVTTSQLDVFIDRWIKDHNDIQNYDEFYDRVLDNQNTPYLLAHHLVSQQLFSALVDDDGKSLSYSGHKFSICANCRPTPPHPVIGIVRNNRSMIKRIVIHRQDSILCLGQIDHPRTYSLDWIESTNHDEREVSLIQIQAEDRVKLLYDILEIIYSNPEANLKKVEAQGFHDKTAVVHLVVSLPDLQYMLKIQSALKEVQNVLQVSFTPASPAQELAILSKPDRHFTNPYLEAEVYDRLNFFDREEQIKQVSTWLKERNPVSWVILHGQPRVGKSSFAKHLELEVLQQLLLANPVYVTLQSLSHFGIQNIANLLAEAVHRKLISSIPEQNPREEPFVWLRKALTEAARRSGGRKILIMIDEFNQLMELDQQEDLSSYIFPNLRSVMVEQNNIRWLLIVQDSYFHNSQLWGGARDIIQQGLSIPISPFNYTFSEKLIRQPAERCGFLYRQNTIPKEIFDLSAGNPYIIKRICWHLIDEVQQHGRSDIDLNDLRQSILVLLNEGERYFDHYLRRLDNLQKIILAWIAQLSPEQGWIPLADISCNIGNDHSTKQGYSIQEAIDNLELNGVVESKGEWNDRMVRIPSRLFRQWVGQNFKI